MKTSTTSFEQRITKKKLPKGLSYPLQTKDIVSLLNTDDLALHYYYDASNPGKQGEFLYKTIYLLKYVEYSKEMNLDYDSIISIPSIPSKLRKIFREKLIEIMPKVKIWQGIRRNRNKKNGLNVYYRTFNSGVDVGGIYIEENMFEASSKLIYRDKNFNIDEEVKEYLR